jgi:hypothetical protein
LTKKDKKRANINNTKVLSNTNIYSFLKKKKTQFCKALKLANKVSRSVNLNLLKIYILRRSSQHLLQKYINFLDTTTSSLSKKPNKIKISIIKFFFNYFKKVAKKFPRVLFRKSKNLNSVLRIYLKKTLSKFFIKKIFIK